MTCSIPRLNVSNHHSRSGDNGDYADDDKFIKNISIWKMNQFPLPFIGFVNGNIELVYMIILIWVAYE